MMDQILLFDLDDTLIHCNKYFAQAIEQFAALLREWLAPFSVDTAMIKQKQLETDMALVLAEGFQPHHFPQSFVETYEFFCRYTGRPIHKTEKHMVWELAQSVFAQEAEPYPNMEETLSALQKQGHLLFLYTGGNPAVQQSKIRQMNLQRYFADRVVIARYKDTEMLESIIRRHRLPRERTWMIGNSIRTDILPALENRLHAIHIPAQSEWEFNIVDVDVKPQGAFFTLSSLQEIPPAIEEYVRKQDLRKKSG
jgi:putative hydrolase of the HAD superfamily